MANHRNTSSSTTTTSSSASNSTSGLAAWSSSKVYKSFDKQVLEDYERLARLQRADNSVARNSPFFPSTYHEYLRHREARIRDEKEELEAAIRSRKKMAKARRQNPAVAKVVPAFGGWMEWAKNPMSANGCLLAHWEQASREAMKADQESVGSDSFQARGRFLLGDALLGEL